MEPAPAYRVAGWNPNEAGSIVWLAADGWSTTRDIGRAATFPDYQSAEARAIELAGNAPQGMTRWRPTTPAETDLRDLQSHERRPWRAATGDTPATVIRPPRTTLF